MSVEPSHRVCILHGIRTARIARAHVQPVGFRVVGDGVPDRATIALRRPVPHRLAGGDIENIHAARRRARITETDRHVALEHAGRTGDERGVVGIECGRAPGERALLRVERDQAPIMRACEQAARGIRQATNTGTRAQFLPSGLGHAGIELPQHFARDGVDGIHDAVAGRDIDHAFDGQRRRLSAADFEIERPRELQAPYRVAIDFSQRAVVGFGGGAADGRPVAGVKLGTRRGLACRSRPRGTNEQCGGGDETQATRNQLAAGAVSGNNGAAVTRPLKSSHWWLA